MVKKIYVWSRLNFIEHTLKRKEALIFINPISHHYFLLLMYLLKDRFTLFINEVLQKHFLFHVNLV